MHPNHEIKLIDDKNASLVCTVCGHTENMARAVLKARLAADLFHDHCPQCQAPYYDYSPEPSGTREEEMFLYGKTVAAVMQHRGQADDVGLVNNIAFILIEKEAQNGLPSFSLAERYVYVVQALMTEVNNGGFEQFFYNSSGELAGDLVPALEAMGLKENKKIAQEALKRFGTPAALDQESRMAHLEHITQDGEIALWEDLDAAFYEDPENFEEKLLDYIAGNLDAGFSEA